MNAFRGKTAIITGGASGMGKGLCLRLAAFGAKIVVADIDAEGAEEAADKIRSEGGEARSRQLDAADDDAVKDLVNEAASAWGRLDYMFNNAGILTVGEIRDMGDDQWRRIMDVNFKGVLTGALAAYKIMAEQGFGHIINTASTAGLISIPTIGAYSATKHAVVAVSTAMRQEAADLGVKVSVVCPGFVDTSIFDKGQVVKGDMDEMLATMPLKPISAEKAVDYIVKGVVKNKGIIIFPFHAKLLWAIYRIAPSFYGWGSRKVVHDFRKLRTE